MDGSQNSRGEGVSRRRYDDVSVCDGRKANVETRPTTAGLDS